MANKALSWILGLILALMVLGLAALWIFVATFDVNQLRPELEKSLSESLGLRAKLGEISVDWGIRLRLKMEGLKIESSEGQRQTLLTAERVSSDVNLEEILSRKISIETLVVEDPKINLIRNTSGNWNWQGSAEPSSQKKDVPPSSDASFPQKQESRSPIKVFGDDKKRGNDAEAVSSLDISLKKIQIRRGTVYFREETVQPPFEKSLYGLEAQIRQAARRAPFEIQAQAGLDPGKPGKDLRLKALVDLRDDEISFNLSYADGVVEIQGDAVDLKNVPAFRGSMEVHQFDLAAVWPQEWKKHKHVTGLMTARLAGQGRGLHPKLLKNTLQLDGSVDLRDGALRNVNFVRQVLNKMTPIPGLEQIFLERMPPAFHEVLHSPDTPFEVAQMKFVVQQGRVTLQNALFQHPQFYLESSGSYGLQNRDVAVHARLTLLESLSAHLLKKVKELQGLANEKGRLSLPFKYEGVLPGARVTVDIGNLTTRLLEKKTGELVEKGLNKLSELLARELGHSPSEGQAQIQKTQSQ